jgi:hypothetical protein
VQVLVVRARHGSAILGPGQGLHFCRWRTFPSALTASTKSQPAIAAEPKKKLEVLHGHAHETQDEPFQGECDARDAGAIFLDEEFVNKVMMNKNLIALNNGVLDTLKMEFRDGKARGLHLLLHQVGTMIPRSLTMRTSAGQSCRSSFTMFDPHPPRCERYFPPLSRPRPCRVLGEAQKFHISDGHGVEWQVHVDEISMTQAMGDYATKASVTMLTQGRGKTGAANPDLAVG